MSNILVNVTRGEVIESRHAGHVVVSDGSGKLIASAGLPCTVTYMRSAAKPIQALNVIFSGADVIYNFLDEELSIMCASHYGEEMHIKVIENILDKIRLNVSDLLCGRPLSISGDYMKRQIYERHEINEINSDCSGKHCGFTAVCQVKKYPLENYNSQFHPMQKELLLIISYMCGIPEDEIYIGCDGCGVPVHGMPLINMAISYARFATPKQLDADYRRACEKLFNAMCAAPQMLAGTNGFCTEFIKNTGGRFCGKLGAEGVYCIGIKNRDMGIVVKIDDGNYRALYPAVMSTLIQLELLSESEIKSLQQFISPYIVNDLGNITGKIEPVFKLEFH